MSEIKKVRCPDCKDRFELDFHEYDDGDSLACPACNMDLTVVYVKDRLKLKTSKELFYDTDESDEFFDNED